MHSPHTAQTLMYYAAAAIISLRWTPHKARAVNNPLPLHSLELPHMGALRRKPRTAARVYTECTPASTRNFSHFLPAVNATNDALARLIVSNLRKLEQHPNFSQVSKNCTVRSMLTHTRAPRNINNSTAPGSSSHKNTQVTRHPPR